ncbi:MAG: DUF975 family protein [Lachnospiraceae bacterium]|nr:DUF975 family protein [Lachnospiraceae bacterium]
MDNNRSVKELRAIARDQLVGKYGIAVPAVLLIAGVQGLALLLSESGASGGTVSSYLLRYVISLIIDLLTGILMYGRSFFFLKIARVEENPSARDVFYGFKNNTDKAVLLQLPYTGLSLLCTIPAVCINLGILPAPKNYLMASMGLLLLQILVLSVAKLFIGLSFFILCDSPELSVPEILAKSTRLMSKRKGRLIIVCLSMLPLMILSIFGLFIGLLWYEAYFRTLLADFYLESKGEEPGNPIKTPESRVDGYSTSDIH